MRRLLVLTLVGLVIAGCAPIPRQVSLSTAAPVAAQADVATKGAVVKGDGIASVATDDFVTEDLATEEAAPAPTAIIITADPTPILLVPIQANTVIPAATPAPLSLAGWQTFVNADLQVAVDYPADWSVAAEADEATFISPQGAAILLKVVNNAIGDSNEIRIGNRRCTSRTNAYHLTADVCVDTASFSYSLSFALKSADGSPRWLILTTTARSTADVLETMFNSVHPAP